MALGSKSPRSVFDAPPPSTRERSDRHEKKIARDYGGRQKSGSGASPYSKGDVVLPKANILVEAKTTDKASYRLEIETLAKISREAIGEGRDPAMEIEILGGDSVCERRWIVLPSSVFRRMLGDD